MAETAVKQHPFNWVAKDVRGTQVKGKSMAANEAAVRATPAPPGSGTDQYPQAEQPVLVATEDHHRRYRDLQPDSWR